MVCSPKLFLKEQLYQALESKRARAHHLAALTLQRYARTFFIKKRFRSLRRKIVLLQSRARGYLARWSYGSVGWGGRRGAWDDGVPSCRQRYRRMRHTLIKFRSLVHIYVNRRRYLKVRWAMGAPPDPGALQTPIPTTSLVAWIGNTRARAPWCGPMPLRLCGAGASARHPCACRGRRMHAGGQRRRRRG